MIRLARRARFYPALAAVLLCGMAPPSARGQRSVLRQFNVMSPDRGGIRLHGVTVFGSYYAGYVPFGVFTQNLPDRNAYVGASASVGWSSSRANSNTSINYSLSYMRALNETGFNSWNQNHNVSYSWGRKIGAKWRFDTSVGGALINLEQSLFSSTQFSNATSVPATIDELAAGMQAGTFTNSEFASLLTGASVVTTPERTYVYGDRVLSASANIGAAYSPSDRSSISFGVSGGRAQRLSRSDETNNNFVIPNTTFGSATIGWSYTVSPRTNVGISGGVNRTFARFQDTYVTRVDFSAGRIVSPRWFLQGRFGTGVIKYTRQTLVAPSGLSYTAGGGVGFKTQSHAFLGSIDRTLSDSYGLGGGSTLVMSGGWTWRRRASPWSLSSTIGSQRIYGSAFGPMNSWSAQVSLARSLGYHFFVSVQYGYSKLPVLLSQIDLSQSGATVTLTWSPAARQ